jgi:hypothetical protein
MRTLQERAISLLETIVGREELNSLLANEQATIFQGGLYTMSHSDLVKSVHIGYHDKSLTDINHSGFSILPNSNSFKKSFSAIENDESKYLQVYIEWKSKSYDKNDYVKDHNEMVTVNNDILLSVYKMFDRDSVFEVRYDFEEFEGVATRFYKFGFRKRGDIVKFKFISSTLNLQDDPYFWNTLSDFISSRYAVYVPSELLKTDYASIIEGLPEQIAWSEFEARYDEAYNKKN